MNLSNTRTILIEPPLTFLTCPTTVNSHSINCLKCRKTRVQQRAIKKTLEKGKLRGIIIQDGEVGKRKSFHERRYILNAWVQRSFDFSSTGKVESRTIGFHRRRIDESVKNSRRRSREKEREKEKRRMPTKFGSRETRATSPCRGIGISQVVFDRANIYPRS